MFSAKQTQILLYFEETKKKELENPFKVYFLSLYRALKVSRFNEPNQLWSISTFSIASRLLMADPAFTVAFDLVDKAIA